MTDPKPTKKRGAKRLLMTIGGALLLLGAGAGAGVGVVKAGLLGGGEAKASAAEHEPSEDKQAQYYAIEQGFTANLRDSETFVQASVAVSSRGDTKVVDAVKANEPAMRSVVLQALAEQDYATVSTPPGRRALRAKLRDALNAELRTKVGFGGIDNVYFTAFVLQ